MGKVAHKYIMIDISDARYMVAVSLFTSKEKFEPRKFLNGIEFYEHPEGGVLIQSSDGKSLIVIWDKRAKISGNFEGGAISIIPKKGLRWAPVGYGSEYNTAKIILWDGSGTYQIHNHRKNLWETNIKERVDDGYLPIFKSEIGTLKPDENKRFIEFQSYYMQQLGKVCKMFPTCQIRAISGSSLLAYPLENIWIWSVAENITVKKDAIPWWWVY